MLKAHKRGRGYDPPGTILDSRGKKKAFLTKSSGGFRPIDLFLNPETTKILPFFYTGYGYCMGEVFGGFVVSRTLLIYKECIDLEMCRKNIFNLYNLACRSITFLV